MSRWNNKTLEEKVELNHRGLMWLWLTTGIILFCLLLIAFNVKV